MIDTLTMEQYELSCALDELASATEAYHNAHVVVDYYNRYGYTEHFKMLIGEEGIIDTAKEIGAQFVAWLKKKITEIITRVKEFFQKLYNRILETLGLKSGSGTKEANDVKKAAETVQELNVVKDKPKPSTEPERKLLGSSSIPADSIAVPYRLEDIYKVLFAVIGDIKVNDIYSLILTGSVLENLHRRVNILREKCQTVEPIVMRKADVHDYAGKFATVIGNLSVEADTLIIRMQEFSNSVNDTDTYEEVTEKACKIFRGTTPNVRVLNEKSVSDRNSSTRERVDNIMKVLVTILKHTSDTVRLVTGVIIGLDRIWNASENAVHVPVAIDPELISDLTGFLQQVFHVQAGTFRPRYAIVTNQDPDTWPDQNGKGSTVVGWCLSGKNYSGVQDLYINYRYYKKLFDHPTREGVKHLLRTIVHECVHIFDSHTGGEFEYNVKYEDRVQEKRAFWAQDIFVITANHVNWGLSLIGQVNRSIKK